MYFLLGACLLYGNCPYLYISYENKTVYAICELLLVVI